MARFFRCYPIFINVLIESLRNYMGNSRVLESTAIFKAGTTDSDLNKYAARISNALEGNARIRSNNQGFKFLSVNDEHYIRLIILPGKTTFL